MTPAGTGRGPARAPGTSSARGAVLIGLAVIVGIVGLQVLDDSGSGSSASSTGTTTTSVVGPSTTVGVRPPAQVRVKVYNASGVDGVGGTTTDMLKAKGYNTQSPATLNEKHTGTAVECRAGFDREATALATAVGNGAAVAPFPSSPPSGSDSADCLVIVGTA